MGGGTGRAPIPLKINGHFMIKSALSWIFNVEGPAGCDGFTGIGYNKLMRPLSGDEKWLVESGRRAEWPVRSVKEASESCRRS